MYAGTNSSRAQKKLHKDVGAIIVETNLYVKRRIVVSVLKNPLRRINLLNTGVIKIK
jgi:hypothetical protein